MSESQPGASPGEPNLPPERSRRRTAAARLRGRILASVLLALSLLVYVNASQSARDVDRAFLDHMYLTDAGLELALQERRGDLLTYALLEYGSMVVFGTVLLIMIGQWLLGRQSARRSRTRRATPPELPRQVDDLHRRIGASSIRSTTR